MTDKAPQTDETVNGDRETPAPPPPPPRRGPGHRGQDMRDTMAEMAAKAHEISLEAGSKMAAAMKDVIGAAAGLTTFAIESARDLVQYMVRRGQMTQDEADKLIREAEEAHAKNPRQPKGDGAKKTPAAAPIPAPAPRPAPPPPPPAPVVAARPAPAAKAAAPAKSAPAKAAVKPPAKAPAKKAAAKVEAKGPASKSGAKKATAKKK